MTIKYNFDGIDAANEPDAPPMTPVTDSHRILIADDSEDDKFLMRISIAKVPRLKIVGEVSNGTEVLAYFKAATGQTHGLVAPPFPNLLLLDLNMPFMDGFEVLEWLRTRSYTDLTVVVLTDSVHPADIKRALDLGADYYQLKSRASQERHALAVALERYLSQASQAGSSIRQAQRSHPKPELIRQRP